MIVIRVELHSAKTGNVTEIGTMLLANDGTSDDPAVGNYDVWLGGKAHKGRKFAIRKKPLRTARVEGYRRKSNVIWKLVKRAVEALYAKE